MRARPVTRIQMSKSQTLGAWELTVTTRRWDGIGPTTSKSWSAPYATVLNAARCAGRRHGLTQVDEHSWVETSQRESSSGAATVAPIEPRRVAG